jgi:prepilin-type N-terminal cleavage/methylation domain-containing protein
MTKQTGFTLLEMAVALVIIGLLLAGMLLPLSAQVDDRKNKETKAMLDEINQALLGFALSKGYLPCPAVSAANGAEDRTGTACNKQVGVIPWATLGVSQTDSWGRLFRYSVNAAYTDSGVGTKFTLTSTSNLKVLNATAGTTIAAGVPAVVLSHGKNGYGAYLPDGAQIPSTGAGTDENTNIGATTDFVSHDFTPDFDDLVVWLSPNTLNNRMVAAGKLP